MIKATCISKIFHVRQKRITALAPCSLALPDCGMIVIVGETGSGKSTLINILSGLEKPTSGTVSCNYGKNYASFVFQNSMLIDSMTLGENLEFALRLYPNDGIDIASEAQKFGLEERLNNFPTELSGGERQRAAVLRAVLEDKPVLFADEPTGSLDAAHASSLASILAQQAKKRLVLVVTHDEDEFVSYADRIIRMERGTIVSDSEKTEKSQTVTYKPSCRAPKFGLRAMADMAVASARKSVVKIIMLAVALFLTVLSVLTFGNIQFSEVPRQVYNALSLTNAVCMDFAQPYGYMECGRLSEERMQYLKDTYGATQFYSIINTINLEDGSGRGKIYRLYVGNECPLELLCGKAELDNDEIAISDYLALSLMNDYNSSDYTSLLGKSVDGMEVVAVYSTNYGNSDKYSIRQEDELVQHSTAYTNEYTSRKYFVEVELYGVQWQREYRVNCEVRRSLSSLYKPLVGKCGNLDTGEIALSTEAAAYFSDDYNSLIGKKIAPQLVFYSGNPANVISYSDEEFTVVGVFSGYMDVFVLGGLSYGEIYFNYADDWDNNSHGISVSGCDKDTVYTMYDEGLVDWSFARVGIINSRQWTMSIFYVLISLIAALSVVTLIMLILYCMNIFTKCRREMGVMRSLGVRPSAIISVYLMQLFIIALVVLAISALCELFVIFFWNTMLGSVVEGMPILYYGIKSIGISLAFLAAVIGIGLCMLFFKIKFKTAAELVYER